MNENVKTNKLIVVEIYVDGQRHLVIADSEEELRVKIEEIRNA